MQTTACKFPEQGILGLERNISEKFLRSYTFRIDHSWSNWEPYRLIWTLWFTQPCFGYCFTTIPFGCEKITPSDLILLKFLMKLVQLDGVLGVYALVF